MPASLSAVMILLFAVLLQEMNLATPISNKAKRDDRIVMEIEKFTS